MKTVRTPRVVVVTRATDYQRLLARHGTRGQASFFLASRGQSLDEVDAQQHSFDRALKIVLAAIPATWRRTRVDRDDLDRFLFEPDDIVVAVGQDGLVPNTAKYLQGQPVIGINPDSQRYEGVLVRHEAKATADLLADAAAGRSRCEERVMARAKLDDGQQLLALNEIFVGQRGHQSARYRIRAGEASERQSSSGLIVATGTGSTGWARSIRRQRVCDLELPSPCDDALAFFVREAWPSVWTGTDLTTGMITAGDALTIVSEMEDDGVVFADGIEEDLLELGWGRELTIQLADQRLRLVVG